VADSSADIRALINEIRALIRELRARPLVIGERWHTVEEAAALLGMSVEFVRDRIRDGSLQARKITLTGRGHYRISDSAIAAFMASRPDGAP
jgi:excisionase family DNA binding protein